MPIRREFPPRSLNAEALNEGRVDSHYIKVLIRLLAAHAAIAIEHAADERVITTPAPIPAVTAIPRLAALDPRSGEERHAAVVHQQVVARMRVAAEMPHPVERAEEEAEHDLAEAVAFVLVERERRP